MSARPNHTSVCFRCTRKERERIREAADRVERSLSGYARRAVLEKVQRDEERKAKETAR